MNKSLRNKLMVGLLCGGALSVAAAAVAQQAAPAPGGAPGAAAGRGGAPGAAGAAGAGRAGAPGAAAAGGGRGGAQPTEPTAQSLNAMLDTLAALPDAPPAKPKKARKVLVLAKAAGFVHSSIPLAAATVKALGDKTGAWSTTVSYDSADINTANLAQYDLVFLDSTTGSFLDDPANPANTAARRAALLDFVRSGKGLAGVHAATDSYHGNPNAAPRGAAAPGAPAAPAAPATPAAGAAPGAAPAAARAPQVNAPLWPEFNKMIGGYFKYHWNYPTQIVVKIDDKKSPLTSMFGGKDYSIHEEVYTFAQDSFSRSNVHVLTSVNYDKMPQATKDQEPAASKRTDGDYALSWIRKEGQGRVFYVAIGHDEHHYAMPNYQKHLLAGIQYALGDLKADDTPSKK